MSEVSRCHNLLPHPPYDGTYCEDCTERVAIKKRMLDEVREKHGEEYAMAVALGMIANAIESAKLCRTN